ncbi:glycosyltransferase family A protein [Saccharolobus shibatae]|uniref:Glycosyltransferase 2-like domain-containing protein n=1 Tax=Saccharolobus shibatae TaxID=2286 RepID=A0A8F5GZX8_9CREN|nr:glycosyltransferase family A protein [Saccharolobus shibatae]QXJ32665.1 hypothetical protein J5U21_02316 [Saccharolobus shibatae]QXJ35789.1 hypothetical protein J5U22_02336 [Saccharolobus shibatae]
MISVIVIEYDRRGFLKDALHSVFSQTLDKSLYEVIVVKRLEDREDDDYAKKNGARIIYDDSPQLGKMLSIGVDESKGDIITFLEDDDKYNLERLAYIHKIFQSKKLSGFRNLHYNIDKNGNIIGKEEMDISEEEIVNSQNYKLKRYYNHLGNNSSIALRREAIDDDVKKIELALDIYFSISSICSDGYYYSPNYLTYYRIHTQNTSMSKNLIRRAKSALRNLSDFQLMYNKYKCSKEIEKTVRLFLLLHKTQLSIYSLFPELNIPKVNLTVYDKLFLLNPLNHPDKNARRACLKMLILSLPSENLKRKIFNEFLASSS